MGIIKKQLGWSAIRLRIFVLKSRLKGGLLRLPSKDSNREELLFAGVLSGKPPSQAAREAGYSESYARVNVYRWLAKASTQQRLQARVREVDIDSVAALRTLEFHMNGDLADILPENEILKAAKTAGVSRLIKKIRVRERFIPRGEGKEPTREVFTEIEIYDAQGAAKHLSSLLMDKRGDDGDEGPIDVTALAKELGRTLMEAAARARALRESAITSEALPSPLMIPIRSGANGSA